MHITLNLRQLRTFVAIVDAGGVGHAANRLHVTQPTASRQIHALEADLGVKLFDRIGRRVRLTAAGEEVLARGRLLLSDADSLCERVRALKAGDAGMLRIGIALPSRSGAFGPLCSISPTCTPTGAIIYRFSPSA